MFVDKKIKMDISKKNKWIDDVFFILFFKKDE